MDVSTALAWVSSSIVMPWRLVSHRRDNYAHHCPRALNIRGKHHAVHRLQPSTIHIIIILILSTHASRRYPRSALLHIHTPIHLQTDIHAQAPTTQESRSTDVSTVTEALTMAQVCTTSHHGQHRRDGSESRYS